MSPFSLCLRRLRRRRGLKQKEVADRLGYEPSYVSALERGEKGPPRRAFVERLIRGLDLDEDERVELTTALAESRRQITLPLHASEEEYSLLHELEAQLGRLRVEQIYLIRLALRLPASLCTAGIDFSAQARTFCAERKEAPEM